MLRDAARAADVSLNEYCVRRLAAPPGSLASVGWAADVVLRAAAFAGDALLAVVAFGSAARGQAEDHSDLDVLIVVADGVALDRELYRRWEGAAPGDPWSGGEERGDRLVDAHFAHLPDPETASPGLWAEVAIDGIVLFERDLLLSSRLAELRRHVADGRLVRRFAQGQPYWVDLRRTLS